MRSKSYGQNVRLEDVSIRRSKNPPKYRLKLVEYHNIRKIINTMLSNSALRLEVSIEEGS